MAAACRARGRRTETEPAATVTSVPEAGEPADAPKGTERHWDTARWGAGSRRRGAPFGLGHERSLSACLTVSGSRWAFFVYVFGVGLGSQKDKLKNLALP